VPAPRHAASGSTPIERLRRVSLQVLAGLLLVMAVTGIWLAFQYKPTSDLVPTIHGWSAVAAVGASLVAAVATAFDDERSTAGLLPAVVILGLVAGLYLTGPVLRWETLGVNGPPRIPHGVTAVFDDDVQAVNRSDNQAVKVGDYRRIAWLHTVALPLGLIAIGGTGVWAVRRQRRAARASSPVSGLADS
jgi:hypothetical protein